MYKPILSVLLAVKNNIDTIDNCLESILNQTISNIEILIVMEPSSDGTLERINEFKKDNNIPIKVIQRDIKFKYPKIKNEFLRKIFLKNSDYAFPDFTSRLKCLNPIFIKKINPYREFKHPNILECFACGFKHHRGKYIVYLDANYVLDSKFVEKCVLPMEKNRNIELSISAVNHVGKYRLIDPPEICKETCIMKSTEAIDKLISCTHFCDVITVFKSNHFNKSNSIFRNFNNQINTPLRMTYGTSLFISERLVNLVVSEDYYIGIFNQSIVSKRFLHIGGCIWRYSTKTKLESGEEIILKAYKNAYSSLGKQCIELAISLKMKDAIKEAKSYVYFAKMVFPQIEIPDCLLELQLIE